MSTAWITVTASALLLVGFGIVLLLAQIDAALKASRPISHEVDGCRCGGGRRG